MYGALYDGEIRFVDDQIARIVRALAEQGLDGQTLVAVTSDHGEDMGEHGYWFSHGWTLFDPALRVPLLLRAPELEPGRVAGPVSLTDVAPTVLALLGIPPPAEMTGRDLTSAIEAGATPEWLGAKTVSARFCNTLSESYQEFIEEELQRDFQLTNIGRISPKRGADTTTRLPSRPTAMCPVLSRLFVNGTFSSNCCDCTSM